MRLLSLHPHATELLFALGAGNMLVGRTDDCMYPASASRIPSLGKQGEISKEMIMVLEPDMVFVGSSDLDLENDYDVIRVAPKTLSDLYSLINRVGGLLSKQVEADMLVHDMKNAFEKIKDKCARFMKTKVMVLRCFENFERPATYILELASFAAGEPYIGDESTEQLQHFDPRMIVVIKPSNDEDERCIERLSVREGWTQIKAVKQELVFVADEGLFRPSPRLIDGAKRLAMILHGVTID